MIFSKIREKCVMRKRLLSLLFAGIFTASSLAQGFPVLAEDQLMTESPAVGMTEQAAQLEQTLQAEQTSDQGVFCKGRF
jgi:hypothetical protein